MQVPLSPLRRIPARMEVRTSVARILIATLVILLLGDVLYMHNASSLRGPASQHISILSCQGGGNNAPLEGDGGRSTAATKGPAEQIQTPVPAVLQSPNAPLPIMFLATDLSPFVIVCLKAARKYNPLSPIYMVTNTRSVNGQEQPMLDLLSIPNVHVKVIEHYLRNGTDSALFHERYIHQSVTAIPFERFCFQRFFVLRDIAKEEGIARFLHMDYDIALFTNIQVFSQYDVDIVALNMHSTFFSLWKTDALQRFCDYQLAFYARPLNEIQADWNKYGESIRNNTFLQFSDMFMLYSYVDKHREVSNKFMVWDRDLGRFTDDYLNYWAMVNLQNFIGWDCKVKDFQSHVTWERSRESRLLVPVVNGTSLMGIHWQGFMCKKIAPLIMEPILRGEVPPEGLSEPKMDKL